MLKSCSNKFLNKAVKCVVIIAIITSSFTAVGCSKQNVNKNKAEDATKQSGETLVSNLKMSLKVIKVAQEKQQWDLSMLDDLCKRLTAIEARSTVDSNIFKDKDGKIQANFYTVITDTEATISTVQFVSSQPNYSALLNRRADSIKTITKIKDRYGIKTSVVSTTVDPYEGAREQAETNPNYLKGVTIEDAPSVSATVIDSGSGGSSTQTQAQTPAKYAGYHLVSAKLSTVSSNEMIYVKYGSHTYGCANQAEYDAVLEKVQAEVSNLPSLDNYYYRYMNGERAKDFAEGSDDWTGLTSVYKDAGYFIYKVDNNATATKALQALGLCGKLDKQARTVEGAPNSAYDVLFRKQSDCDAEAHLQSAIHDAMGFSSMIGKSSSHADEYVNIAGKWWKNTMPSNPNSVAHLTEPTF